MQKWVNFQSRVLTENRYSEFKDDLDIPVWEASGILLHFWLESQSNGFWKGTKEEIIRFIAFYKDRKEECFQALLNNRFISEGSDGLFVIRGNRQHIEAIVKNREQKSAAGKIGGKISAKNRKTKGEKPNDINVNQTEPSKTKQPQANSIQFNTIQEEEKNKESRTLSAPRVIQPDLPEFDRPDSKPHFDTPNKIPQPPPKPKSGKPFKGFGPRIDGLVQFFRDEHGKKYPGTELAVTNAEKASLKRILQAVEDPESAKVLIAKYLSIDDHWFKTKAHDIRTLEINLTKVQTAVGKRKIKWDVSFDE